MSWETIILTPTISDAALLTASSASTSFPVKNLQRKQPGEVWRPGDLAAWVLADLGEAVPVTMVSMISLNASTSATWRVRGYDALEDVTADAPGYDSGIVAFPPSGITPNWPMIIGAHTVISENALSYLMTQGGDRILTQEGAYLLAAALGVDAPASLRFWRIDVSDPDNDDGYLDFGRLYISNELPFSIGPQYSASFGYTTQTKKMRSVGGQRYSTDMPSERVIDFTIDFAGEKEMLADSLEIDLSRGTGRDILCLLDRNAAEQAAQKRIYGEFESLQPVTIRAFNVWQKRFQIEELLP